MTTIALFALITVGVAGAGFAGIALWGPEKNLKSRTALASTAPAMTFSLPSSVDEPPASDPPAASASAAPEPSAPAAASAAAPAKKKPTKKSPQRHRGKKKAH